MKVAILGYGRQGKKHKQALENYGISPDIFTRFGSGESVSIASFSPRDYSIIIIAIDPIEEQTRMIHFIIGEHYENYLIIEKPVTYSGKLLEKLTVRKRTLFLIDELYIPLYSPQTLPKQILTTSGDEYSGFAITEHAIANFLSLPSESLDFSKIIYSHSTAIDLTYTLIFEDARKNFFMNMRDLNFGSVYKGLLLKIQDESFHKNIRNNYLKFRLQSPSFGQYLQG